MQPFEPVQPYRMAKQIVSRIYNMILDGEIPAGGRLPSERTLADRFNVSRPTLRVAIHVLEALGLVRVRPGGGTYVSKNPVALSSQILEHLLQRDGDLLFELIAVRVEFETRNAELAARNATADDVRDLA
ncbi:MAG: FadR family transcriptional regulator, partial [Rubrivivax sp.]|nr:FadR family transcriptional regulator [Rubrivivax sp.]